MNIIKTKQSRDILASLKDYNYDPNKTIQYCKTYQNKEDYIENIKEQFETLGKCIIAMIIMSFTVLYQVWCSVQSLFPYSLVITKKRLK